MSKPNNTLDMFEYEQCSPYWWSFRDIDPKRIARINDGDTRFYYEVVGNEVLFFPSVTTVIGATLPKGYGFEQWLKQQGEEADTVRDNAAHFGTFCHILIAEFLIAKECDLDSIGGQLAEYCAKHGIEQLPEWEANAKNVVQCFAQFAFDYNVRPLAIEAVLSSRSLGIAGAIDIVCAMDITSGSGKNKKTEEVIAIVDIKTSKNVNESHIVQLHAYKHMWEENFPNTKIDALFNFYPKEFGTKTQPYTLADQTDKLPGRKLIHLIHLYKLGGKLRPSPKKIAKGVVRLGEEPSNTLGYIDIAEHIAEQARTTHTTLFGDVA